MKKKLSEINSLWQHRAMSQFCIEPGPLSGTIAIPPSKSQTLRAILFGALGRGQSRISHCLDSPDTRAMCTACQLFGAKVQILKDEIEIEGVNGQVHWTEDVIDAGNSGIVLRFCSAVGALGQHPVVITGDYSIRHCRPMEQLLDGLRQLGASAVSMRGDGYAPVIIKGPIKPGKAFLSGEDSQPVSALLIAGAFAEGPIDIEVSNAGEKPWVGLTLSWFDRLGIPYENHDFHSFRLKGQADYAGFTYQVSGDLSSAAFPIAAALVANSEMMIENIDLSDDQGDKELVNLFKKMGAQFEVDARNRKLLIKRTDQLSGISIDINNCIDALPILAVVACFAKGETVIRNGAIARQKECNRIRCITTELSKMGAEIKESADGLIIKESPLKGALLHTYHDHRMAMALSVAAFGAKGKSIITPVDCITKTFPHFARQFSRLGARIEALN